MTLLIVAASASDDEAAILNDLNAKAGLRFAYPPYIRPSDREIFAFELLYLTVYTNVMDPLPNSPSAPEPAPQPDWARLLPRDAFTEIILILRGALPPPGLDDPDEMTWQDWARRDRAAMAAVAALLPENAAEGRLAARFVVADAWSLDCLRLARERRHEPDVARKCTAQALSLMRESNSALRLLLRLQAARRRIEKDAAASGRAAWVEHAAVGSMGEALGLNLTEPEAPAAPTDVGKFRLDAENGLNSWLTARETKTRLPPVSVAGSVLAGGGAMQGALHPTTAAAGFTPPGCRPAGCRP